MIDNGTGAKNIFRQVEQIQIVYMHTQSFGYFGLQGIRNVNQALTEPLEVSYLQNLDQNSQ